MIGFRGAVFTALHRLLFSTDKDFRDFTIVLQAGNQLLHALAAAIDRRVGRSFRWLRKLDTHPRLGMRYAHDSLDQTLGVGGAKTEHYVTAGGKRRVCFQVAGALADIG